MFYKQKISDYFLPTKSACTIRFNKTANSGNRTQSGFLGNIFRQTPQFHSTDIPVTRTFNWDKEREYGIWHVPSGSRKSMLDNHPSMVAIWLILIPHMRTMVLEYSPTFALKSPSHVGFLYTSTMVRINGYSLQTSGRSAGSTSRMANAGASWMHQWTREQITSSAQS